MESMHKRLVILGSGPAGYSAALYASRAGLNPTLISGPQKGGQLTTTTTVDNWIGAYDGIQGPDLMLNMEKHIDRFGVEKIDDIITSTDLSNSPFILTGEKNQYKCDALIIATGASAKYLGLPSEKQFHGRGVSACATCDGFFFKNQEVAVIGGGNTAIEEAIFLSNMCKKVTLVHRRNALRAEKIMQEDLFKLVEECKIEIQWSSELIEIKGDSAGVTSILIKNKETNKQKDIPLAGVFIAIGHEPNTKIFVNQLEMTNGYINIKSGQNGFATETSVKGVFAAGDVSDSVYRQAITSAGFGAMAALDVEKYLTSVS